MSLSRPTGLRRSPARAASRLPRVLLLSAGAAVLLGSLAVAGTAHAAVTGRVHTQATPTNAQLPSWYHTPLTTVALSNLVAVPKDPEAFTGKLRLTKADYRNGSGKLAVDASQAIGQTLIAGESLQLPGDTLFSLNSHLPASAGQQEITQLKPALINVTGVTCEGYTDYGPNSARRDIKLGKQRALRVCGLIHTENPRIAIKTVTYGSTLPAIVGGTTHPPRSLNRRVIIDITSSTPPPTFTPAPTPTPAPAATVPGPPTLNSATPGDGKAVAKFAAPPSGGKPTSYEVSTDGGATWTPVTTTGASPYSITISGLTDGTTYTVEVRAVDSIGDSGPSNSLQVTPVAPPALNSVTGGDGQATVTFAAPTTNANDPPTGYEVSTDAGATWTSIATSDESPYTVTVTGLTNGTTYTVEVRADGTGNSDPSNSMQVTPATVPDGPFITAGSSVEDNGSGDYIVTLSWTLASDGGSAVTAWQESQASAPYAPLTGVTYDAGTYTATFDSGYNACGPDPGDATYTIEATNGVGTGVASNSYDVSLDGPGC